MPEQLFYITCPAFRAGPYYARGLAEDEKTVIEGDARYCLYSHVIEEYPEDVEQPEVGSLE